MAFIDYIANGLGFAFTLYQAGFYNIPAWAYKPYNDARIDLLFINK